MAACSTQETSWEKKLDTSLAYLSGNFNPNEKFLDALMAAQLPNGKCLLDYQERQKLDSCNLARSKLNELIAIVRFKHPREVAFELFCETLIATGNKAVVEEFNKPKNTGYEEPQLIPRSANSSAGLKKEDALASGMERLGLSSMSPDGLDNDSHNAAPRPAYSSTRLPSQGSGGPYSSGGHRKSLDSEGSVHKRTGASNSQSSRYGSTFLNKACDEVPQLPSGDLSKSDLRSHIASLTEEIFKFIGIIKIQTKKLKETQEKAKSTKRDLCQSVSELESEKEEIENDLFLARQEIERLKKDVSVLTLSSVNTLQSLNYLDEENRELKEKVARLEKNELVGSSETS